MRKIVLLLIFLLLIPLAFAAPPALPSPEIQQQDCEMTGGEWSESEFSCLCPEETTFLDFKCWVKTRNQACEELGGFVEFTQPVCVPVCPAPPPPLVFRCKSNPPLLLDLTQEATAILNESAPEPAPKSEIPWLPILVVAGILWLVLRRKK